MVDTTSGGLDAALEQFERVGTNLAKAERVWAELEAEQLSSPDHDDRIAAFIALAAALPPIDGFVVDAEPMRLHEMQLARFDAFEVGEPSFHVEIEESIAEPGNQLREYRRRFDHHRRSIVRDRARQVTRSADAVVSAMRTARDIDDFPDRDVWQQLSTLMSELDRLLGSAGRPPRWHDLARHLSFAEQSDLYDIVDRDWPAVRDGLDPFLFAELEPVPVDDVADLGELAAARPTGPVSAGLRWERLDASGFERLLFELLSGEPGYENVNWKMHTNAPDSGRDVEARRLLADGLSGTRRERVIVQCKHTGSVGRDDLVTCVEAIRAWEPPAIDLLIVATTGTFSRDAVAWAEQRNERRTVPLVELWAHSHLEMLLARRPHLIVSFHLR